MSWVLEWWEVICSWDIWVSMERMFGMWRGIWEGGIGGEEEY